MDYFTSDLHIGHDKPFIWQARGFNSIEEHDTQILLRWNTAVSPEDTVYTLTKIEKYVNEYDMEDLGLAAIYKYSKKKKFYLSHYPTLVDNHESNKFFWNLSGHIHSKYLLNTRLECVYNVAMDAHNCTPVSIEQIIKDIEEYKIELEKEKWRF